MSDEQNKEIVAPFHFLLTSSEMALGNFEIVKLSEAANARAKLHEDLDRWIDLATQAAIVRLFRARGRKRILKALQETPTQSPKPKPKLKTWDARQKTSRPCSPSLPGKLTAPPQLPTKQKHRGRKMLRLP
jgi:hypothetical protein